MEMNLGILGFGGMGHWHADHASTIAGVNLVAACDIDALQLADSGQYGIKTYLNNEDAFFADPDINTVLLTVPNHLHHKYALKAAKAGKNIICEKPAALSIADFDEMVKTAKSCGVLFTVHQNRRWDKDFRIVKKIYDQGTIGNIFNIESTLHSPNGLLHNWHTFKKYGGGMVYDWGVHMIDQILFMIPEKLEYVYADLKGVFSKEVDDFFRIILKFKNDQTAVLSLSTYCLKPSPRWLVCGDKGTVCINSFAGDGKLYKTSKLLSKLPPKIEPNVAGPTRSFIPVPPGVLLERPLPEVNVSWTSFYENYVDVINGKADFVIKVSEVRRVLAVIDAVFQSAEAKRSIHFDYDDDPLND